MHKNTLLCKEKYYNRVIAKKKSANLADFFNTSMSQDPKLYVWIQTEQESVFVPFSSAAVGTDPRDIRFVNSFITAELKYNA